MTRYSAGKASATLSLPNWNVGPKHAAALSNLGYKKTGQMAVRFMRRRAFHQT